MTGLGLAVGIKTYCPPGTGNCRNRPGDRFPGTAWIGQYWRQDASRSHGARRMEGSNAPGVEAPHGGYEEDPGETVPPQCRELQCEARGFPMPNCATAVLAAVESLPFGVAVTDPCGNITWANPLYAQQAGLISDELVGQQGGQFDWDALAHAAPSSEPYRSRTLCQQKSGDFCSVEHSITTLRNSAGEVTGFWIMKRDTTGPSRSADVPYEAKDNLSALIESTSDLIVSVDLEYRLVTFNKALRENIKWNIGAQAAVGMRLEEWLPPQRYALWPPMFDRALSEGPFRTEYSLLNGRTLELSFNPIRQDDRTVGVSVFGKDITERKAAEKGLREAESKYRNIFDGAVEGLYQTSLEGKPITGNLALAKMLGYESPEEGVRAVTDVALQVWLDPNERSHFVKLLEDQGVVRGYESQFKRKDGTPLWASLNSRIVRDVEGKAPYIEGFVEDISGRKRSEAALKQANQATAEAAANLSALIESTEDLIGSFDLEYRLLTFNKALADTIKRTVGVKAVVGMRLDEWLAAHKVALWPPMFARALSQGTFRSDYPLVDGRTAELSFNPIRQDGGTVGISVFGKDITERKRAQATIQQANEAVAKAEARYRLMFNSV